MCVNSPMVHVIANEGHAYHDHGRHKRSPTCEEKHELLVLSKRSQSVVDRFEVHHIFLHRFVAFGEIHGGGCPLTAERISRTLYALSFTSILCCQMRFLRCEGRKRGKHKHTDATGSSDTT